jgi:hypothetical protein
MVRMLSLLLILSATTASAEVYKWVDDNGVVQYGDRPPAGGAETVDLPPSSVYQPRPLPSVVEPEEGAPAAQADTAGYKRLAIRQPGDDATVRDNTGAVELEIDLEPELQQGHRIAVLLDGRTIFDQLEITRVSLSNVDRGTHRLRVKVLDADGAEQAASEPVTFHMHRATALRPSPRVRPRTPPN